MTAALEQKSVIVTGAGRGLGRAYARALAAAGASVLVNDVDLSAAEAVAEEVRNDGGAAIPDGHTVDDWSEASEIIKSALRSFGRLDGLVNNAGLFYVADPGEDDPEEAEKMVAVNLLGTLYCGMHAIRHMKERRQGSIVNDTSGAQSGMRRRGVYGATKGATASLTYSWALDLEPYGIRVNAISPIARTAMVDYGVRLGEAGTNVPPENVAPLVTYLVSPESDYVTGRVLRLEGDRLSLMSRPGANRRTERAAEWTPASIEEVLRRLVAEDW